MNNRSLIDQWNELDDEHKEFVIRVRNSNGGKCGAAPHTSKDGEVALWEATEKSGWIDSVGSWSFMVTDKFSRLERELMFNNTKEDIKMNEEMDKKTNPASNNALDSGKAELEAAGLIYEMLFNPDKNLDFYARQRILFWLTAKNESAETHSPGLSAGLVGKAR